MGRLVPPGVVGCEVVGLLVGDEDGCEEGALVVGADVGAPVGAIEG